MAEESKKEAESAEAQTPPEVDDPLIGKIFADKYEIISVLGRGGMSTVYKATHKYMERIVALKVLHKHLLSDPTSVERFQKESKATSVLSHPNIITVFDFGVSDGETAFLVMDYLEGTTLGDIIDSSGPLIESDALIVFRQIAKGLIHAHARKIIHRDLKPRNLVLTLEEDGSVLVQIVDFGIAKMVAGDAEQALTLTQTGEVFGSPLYMSPEQCSAEELDVRSDIYSFGCVMYETLTGLPPFLGKNAVETMSMHVEDEPPSFNEVMPQNTISKKLEKLVFRCLEKKRENRYESVQELLEDLPEPTESRISISSNGTSAMSLSQLVASSSTSVTRAIEKRPNKRKKQKSKIGSNTLAIIFGAALLVVLLFVSIYPGPQEDPGPPIKKMKWQLLMTLADLQIRNKNYENSLPLLDWALSDAKNLSGEGRAKNYDKIFETLVKQVKVYSSLGMDDKQQQTVRTLSKLEKERWVVRGNQYIADLLEAKKLIEKLRGQGKDPRNFRDKEPLNLKGDSSAIIELAKRLDLVQEYSVEENLLELADELFKELYGQDYIELSDIKLQLAECLKKEDQIQEITQLNLYQRVVEIRRNNNKLEGRKDVESPEYIRALLKLGQWQRDRSHFDEARKNLTKSIELAKASNAFSNQELTEFYNSYADFLRQVGNTEEAKTYEKLAKELHPKHSHR